jgi:hypothetical protein
VKYEIELEKAPTFLTNVRPGCNIIVRRINYETIKVTVLKKAPALLAKIRLGCEYLTEAEAVLGYW